MGAQETGTKAGVTQGSEAEVTAGKEEVPQLFRGSHSMAIGRSERPVRALLTCGGPQGPAISLGSMM